MDYKTIKINTSVLVLNSDYNPINICNSRRAIVLLLKRKAHMITEKVIRLIDYVRLPYQKLTQNRPTRNLVYKRDAYTCAYCGAKEHLTIDHIYPTSRGGQNTWDNMVTCCSKCNSKKGNRTPTEAGMILKFIPQTPYNKIHLAISTSNVQDWKDYIFT
jgi:5-methylcytosine-specific restriction endonuclease McrA